MALLKCPECGEHVSEFAKACPNCGCPMSDISQENQVVDKSWDKKKEKRATYTQAYTQEELNKALEDARAGKSSRIQRKPGQKRIVKNSESILPERSKRSKKKNKSKKGAKNRAKSSQKSSDLGLKIALIVIGVLAVIGIGIFCFAALFGDDERPKITEEPTDMTQSTRDQNDYRYDEDRETSQTTRQSTTQSRKETTQATRQTTKQTIQRQTTKTTTAPPTTQPPTQPPTEPPTAPAEDPIVPGGEDA